MEPRGAVTSETLRLQRSHAGPGVARALNLSEGDSVIYWRRLRYLDGCPAALQDVYLNEVLLPGFSNSVEPGILYGDLTERGLRPAWAEDAISAGLATSTDSTALAIAAQSPVLRYERRGILPHDEAGPRADTARQPLSPPEAGAVDSRNAVGTVGDVVIEVSRSVYPADRYTARLTLRSG